MNWDAFKKPGVESKPEQRKEQGKSNPGKAQPKPAPRPEDTFEELPDEEKAGYAYVSGNYDGVRYPENWARDNAEKAGVSENILAKAANKFMQDFKKAKMSKDELNKWPFWSAARDWNTNNPIWGNRQWESEKKPESFKFDPDMVASVRSQYY